MWFIYLFFVFYVELKFAIKSGGKMIKNTSRLQIPCGSKNFVKISQSLQFQDKQVLAFNTEIQDGSQKSDIL